MTAKTTTTDVSKKFVSQTGKSLLDNVESCGGFYSCLSEVQGVSAWCKETAQTRVFVLSRSLLVNHLEPQSSKTKLLLPIMAIGIAAYTFTLLWDNLCRISCI